MKKIDREIKQGWCYKRRNKPYFIIEINTEKGNEEFIISYSEAIKFHNSIEKAIKKRKFWGDKKEISKEEKLYSKISLRIKSIKPLLEKHKGDKNLGWFRYYFGKVEILNWVLKLIEPTGFKRKK